MNLALIAITLMLTGCFAPSNAHLRNLVVAQRECEATPISTVDGFWARSKWMAQCSGNGALPAACEAPGTEDSPACMNWAAAAAGQAQGTAIAGSAGWGVVGSAVGGAL